eukprot:gene13576-16053_t
MGKPEPYRIVLSGEYGGILFATALFCCLPGTVLTLEFLFGTGTVTPSWYGQDRTIRVYDIETGRLLATLKGHNSSITNISVSTSEDQAVTCSQDAVIVWNLKTWERARVLGTSGYGAEQASYTPVGHTVLTSFKDDSVLCLIDIDLQKELQQAEVTLNYNVNVYIKELNIVTVEVGSISDSLMRSGVPFQTQHVSDRQGQAMVEDLPTSSQMLDSVFQPRRGKSKLAWDVPGTPPVPSPNLSSNAATCTPSSATPSKRRDLDDRLGRAPTDPGSITPRTREARNRLGLKPGSQDPEKKKLSLSRLRSLLDAYGEFPEKHRLLVWKFLMDLPGNTEAHNAILSRGPHPAFQDLHERFPIKNRSLVIRLELIGGSQSRHVTAAGGMRAILCGTSLGVWNAGPQGRMLSALSHWAPIFAEAAHLPAMVFPFVKLFGADELACFEALATILSNWTKGWFELFPAPPLKILDHVEALVLHHDPELHYALTRNGGGVSNCAWAIMQSLFTEVFSKEEWLKVWDHILANNLTFVLFIAANYLIFMREMLISACSEEETALVLSRSNPIDVNRFLRKTYAIRQVTPTKLHPADLTFEPLTKGADSYPIFKGYPKVAVDAARLERERLKSQEETVLQRKRVISELAKRTEMLERQETEWEAEK